MVLVVMVVGVQMGQKLCIGFVVGYVFFSEVGSDGQFKGFEIDFVQVLCKCLVLQCVLVIFEFDGLVLVLQLCKIDVIMVLMFIMLECEQVIVFIVFYYYLLVCFVMCIDVWFDFSLVGLKGWCIGVECGIIYECFVVDVFKDSQVLCYVMQDQVFFDLCVGWFDVMLVDVVIVQFGFLNQVDGCGFGFVGLDFGCDMCYYGKGIGIGLCMVDVVMFGRCLDEVLVVLCSSGVFKVLNDCYFNFDFVSVLC